MRSRKLPSVRCAVFFAAAFLTARASYVHAFQQADANSPETLSDWLRIVPGDVRFYAELRDLAGVRAVFQNLGIWDIVRELSARPTRNAVSRPWHQKAEQILGMDRDEAIDRLLGRRSALIASMPDEWQDGVLIAELGAASELPPLIKRWNGKRLEDEGPVQRYTLSGGLMLAALDRIILLGPAGDPEGLWSRTVLLLSGRRGPNLAGRSEFASLRSRVSGSYPGLLYVTWPEDDPTAIAGCNRLLVGVSVTGTQIVCALHGQRTSPYPTTAPCDADVIRRLPASTLAVYSDSFDFAALSREVKSNELNDVESFLAFLINTFSTVQGRSSDLLNALGPPYTVVIGPPAGASREDPRLPAVSMILPTKEGQASVQHLDDILGFVAQLIAILAVGSNAEGPEISVQKEPCEGVELHSVEFGPALAKRAEMPLLEHMELCWFLMDQRLVLSTSIAQSREIIRAARGKAASLGASPALAAHLPTDVGPAPLNEWVFMRGTASSKVLSDWIAYLEKNRPEMLSPTWWQTWAAGRIEHYTRLGLVLVPDKTSPVRAVVQQIDADSPARNVLQTGDIVLAAAGRALTTTRPAREVAQRYRDRGQSRRFHVRVLRAGRIMDLQVPVQPASPIDLHDFDPILALRQIAALTRHVDTVTLRRQSAKPDRMDAHLIIRWESSP